MLNLVGMNCGLSSDFKGRVRNFENIIRLKMEKTKYNETTF